MRQFKINPGGSHGKFFSFSGNCRTGYFTILFFAVGVCSCQPRFFATVSFFLRLRGITSGSYFATCWEVIGPSYDRAAVDYAGMLVGQGAPVMNFIQTI